MFSPEIYQKRRDELKKKMETGVLFFPGNNETPMNYPANPYHFRQDSSFLYYFGIDEPGLTGVIDVDNDEEIIFGDDVAIEDIIWTGPLPKLTDKAARFNISDTRPSSALGKAFEEYLNRGREIMYLPQYRQDITNMVGDLTDTDYSRVNSSSSVKLARAVISQRSIKSDEEVGEIEKALEISYDMNRTAMKLVRDGVYEYEVCGKVQAAVLARNSHLSFPIIFSIHGETLHNHSHNNMMSDGDILIMDSGAESPLHYASDITRTIPVSGEFNERQKYIYQTVLQSQLDAIEMMKPGVMNLECHLKAAHTIASGLTRIGLMKGDPEEAVRAGAHALFFPHGLGHMMGLDVHDMEGLGEDLVGYDEKISRSDQFGLAALRLARELEPGFVITVEPGIYFIPELIDRWKEEDRFAEFINYDKVEKYRNFGGIRIEDDVLITESGHRVLGKPIAKEVDEVQDWCTE